MAPRILPCLPTFSMGHGSTFSTGKGHSLPAKLEAAAAAGFASVEMFYACLESYALELAGSTERDALRQAARAAKKVCDKLGLGVLVLQPVMNYDGILDEAEHRARVDEIVFRFELCHLLGTDMLQVPAQFRLDDGVTGDEAKIVADLREIADLALQQTPPIRLTYENMCWSRFAPRWQDGWRVVQKVDRPNFGLVLDSFHMAGYEFADPTQENGERSDAKERMKASLKELVATVPANKIFYVEAADAERLSTPLSALNAAPGRSPFEVPGQAPRMSWSRNCRLFPGETQEGGYLPVDDIIQAFVDVGFEGTLSFEVFNRSLNEDGEDVPASHAKRGWAAWERLQAKFGF